MKFVSFSRNDISDDAYRGVETVGALLDEDTVLDFTHSASELPEVSSDLEWYDLDGAAYAAAAALVAGARDRLENLRALGAVRSVDDVELRAPIRRPGKVICIGLNYLDHAKESGLEVPKEPLVFSKFSNCVVGPDVPVILPVGSKEVDYEAEMGVVIGRAASNVSKADALDHVFGYCNVNDVSARDFQFADGQWQRGKSCDTFCPMGPFVATRDEVGDPHALRIRFRLNDKTLQDSSTDQLIFDVPALVAHLSSFIALEPGDLISTGTPPGVGFARKPPVYLKAGDRMEVEVEGLGVLRNPVVGGS